MTPSTIKASTVSTIGTLTAADQTTSSSSSTDNLIEFQQIPVIAIQSPINDTVQQTLKAKGLSAVPNTALLKSPVRLLDSSVEWIFEDQPRGTSTILSVSQGNVSYYTMNTIAFLMVVLAIYQLVIDGLALFNYVDNQA